MEVERVLKADCEKLAVIAIHPKGEHFVTTCEKGILKLWHVETGTCRQLRGHTRRVLYVLFSPLGEMICTCSADFSVRLWDTEGAESLMLLTGHEDKVTCGAFDSRGRSICTTSLDKNIRIWRVMDGRCTKVLGGEKLVDGPVTSCLMSVMGATQKQVIVCGCDDGSVAVIDVAKKERLMTLKGHEKGIKQCMLHPLKQELLCTSSEDGTLRLWNLAQGECTQVIDGEFGDISAFSFIPRTGHLIFACCRPNRPPENESTVGKFARSTLMFLASGAGSKSLHGAGWGEGSAQLVLVGFDGNSFSAMMASEMLHIKNEMVTSACFTESAEGICSVTGKKVYLWDIKYKAIVPSNHRPGEGEIAINIFEPDAQGRTSDEEVEEDTGAGAVAGTGIHNPPEDGRPQQFLPAPAHVLSSYPPNFHEPRAVREADEDDRLHVEQRLLTPHGAGNGAGEGRRRPVPRQQPELNTSSEIEEEDPEDEITRVTASVGWSLKPVEPASNTITGVRAVPISDDEQGVAAGAGVGLPRVKNWTGKAGGAAERLSNGSS
mmetsp:Transcript_12357/g.24580  ORF Transcript_12357/g.24580 Transcript_12357/m.24580 type:complete len:547 (-) Transcript_12357:456-2096(-)